MGWPLGCVRRLECYLLPVVLCGVLEALRGGGVLVLARCCGHVVVLR